MAKSVNINEISDSKFIRNRLKEIDQNKDGKISTEEAANKDGFMRCNGTVGGWTKEDMRRVEHALFSKGLVRFQRDAACEAQVSDSKTINPQGSDVGHVYFIKQRHHIQKAQPEEIKAKTDAYQYDMLKKLLEMDVKHVFDEGVILDWKPEIYQNFSVREDIKKHFPEGQLPDRPNAEQMKILRKYGATIVYALIKGDVHIHPLINNNDTYKRTNEAARVGYSRSDKSFTNDTREKEATQIIMDFLKEHPGEKVALVYGRAHNFWQHFEKEDKPPAFTEVEFTRALRESREAKREARRGRTS